MALGAFHFALCVRLGASEVAVKASFLAMEKLYYASYACGLFVCFLVSWKILTKHSQ